MQRKRLFVDNFIANGENATNAAIAAGYSVKTAAVQGCRLLRNVQIQQEIVNRREQLAAECGINATSVIRSMARALHFDPRKLYREDGTLKDVSELDDDTADALASLEVVAIAGSGKDGETPAYVKKYKWESKSTARDQACKHLGLYKKDNEQKPPAAGLYAMSMEELEKIARGGK